MPDFIFRQCLTLSSLCATGFLGYRFCTVMEGLHSPFLAFLLVVLRCFLVASCLDEDCIPGWGECGRPLRL